MVTLSADQERRLAQHAAARNLTPAEALDALLDAPTPQRRPWTDEELDYLRNPHNSPRDIARKFGRSTTAISVRRNQLAKDENIPALMRPRKPKDPAPDARCRCTEIPRPHYYGDHAPPPPKPPEK